MCPSELWLASCCCCLNFLSPFILNLCIVLEETQTFLFYHHPSRNVCWTLPYLRIIPSVSISVQCLSKPCWSPLLNHLTIHHHHTQPFYSPFSWTTRESQCHKRTSGLYGAREVEADTDNPAGCHSIQTNQCPPPPSPIFTGWMPFLPPNQQHQSTEGKWSPNNHELECGLMPNVMAALPNIGVAVCSTPQSLADAHY